MNKPQIELDIETKKFLSDFYSIISSLDIPMLLIGAQARLLIFDIPYQIEGRATKDIEFTDQIIAGDFEFDEAIVIFLGRNIRNKFRQETLQEIKKIIAKILQYQNRYLSEITPKNSDTDLWDQNFEKIVRQFELLQKGLENPSGTYRDMGK
jgi:predicted TIM-barrel fold metal-dependent hydrolase